MFPTKLDNAKVLYYTPKDNYGVITYPDGKVTDYYNYLAICAYPDDNSYYLFCCNAKYEVVSDWVDASVANCMKIAASSYKENIQWIQVR